MVGQRTLKIACVILYRVKMKLKTPFTTSYRPMTEREFFVIEVQNEEGLSGWGETVAFSAPWYTEETVKTNEHILLDFLIPLLLEQPFTHPEELISRFSRVRGNPMAKAGLEGAVWDLYAKQLKMPLYKVLGGQKKEIEVGVSLGIEESVSQLLRQIELYLEQGYRRFKVKIKPGWDVDVIQEIRRHYPKLPLMADANGAYCLEDADGLKALDPFNLMMIEQPLTPKDLVDHAQLQKQLSTPICLDESITSQEDVRQVVALESCKIINLKIGRVGGLTSAKQIHDFCQLHCIPLWCGGMLESGIGRAHNIALSTLSQFCLPGDLSASNRYWEKDLIEPEVTVQNGVIQVSDQAGLGYVVSREELAKHTYEIKIIRS